MPTNLTYNLIELLRRTGLLRDGVGRGDGELLGCFIERHDEAALAALVQRHGPMVWGVCRRLLSHHDAEDAFQATFLVLVRKAASVMPREMVGNWLYGVAHQTALQARRTAARRRGREVQVMQMPDTEAVRQDQGTDLRLLLDQEVSRLPDHYRAVIVLCDLEGRTRREVARQLGVPEGTVAGRLARARALLAKRLTKRGVTLSGGALMAVLSLNVASAGVPDSVVVSTISAGRFFLAGPVAAGGPVSVKVAALTEGVLKAMLMSKLKAVVAVVLVLGLIGTGAIVLSYRTAAAQSHKPLIAEERAATPQKQEPEREKKGFSTSGKEVGIVSPGHAAPPEVFPTQEEMRLLETAKRFCVTMRNHHGDKNANALREFIDPRYLKKHDLTGRDLSVPMPALGAIFDLQLADDGQTILCVVQTKANANEPVKEVLLLRVSDYEGRGGTRYLLPSKAPDPKTGSFTPWILRTKL